MDALREMGYEKSDLSVSGIRNGAIWLFALLVVCIILPLFALQLIYPNAFEEKKVSGFAVTPKMKEGTPLLQSNLTTKTDIQDMRQNEELVLSTSTYLNKEKGIVRIPIARAMDLIAERGIIPTGKQVSAVTKGNTTGQN